MDRDTLIEDIRFKHNDPDFIDHIHDQMKDEMAEEQYNRWLEINGKGVRKNDEL